MVSVDTLSRDTIPLRRLYLKKRLACLHNAAVQHTAGLTSIRLSWIGIKPSEKCQNNCSDPDPRQLDPYLSIPY
jgi:hypothetical protein